MTQVIVPFKKTNDTHSFDIFFVYEDECITLPSFDYQTDKYREHFLAQWFMCLYERDEGLIEDFVLEDFVLEDIDQTYEDNPDITAFIKNNENVEQFFELDKRLRPNGFIVIDQHKLDIINTHEDLNELAGEGTINSVAIKLLNLMKQSQIYANKVDLIFI